MAQQTFKKDKSLGYSLVKAGDPHGARFCIPAFFPVPEGLHTTSNTVTGFYYGHLVVHRDI